MIVVDAEDKAHLLEQQQHDLPPPYQFLHPPQVPPRSHHARPHSAGPYASTSSLNSASASGSGSSRPLLQPNVRHAHSVGEIDFNPYDLVQYGHQQAATYSHPPPQVQQRHSFHNQHPHPHHVPTTHTRPMSPRRHSATQPSPLLMHAPSPAPPLPSPSAAGMHPQRRHSDSPVPRPSSARRGSLLATPIHTQPAAAASMVLPAPLSPEAEAVEQGRRYQEQLLARCAAGDHAPYYSYGPAGIISSVLLFPVGLVCLCLDRERRCARCGERLDGRRLQRARRPGQ